MSQTLCIGRTQYPIGYPTPGNNERIHCCSDEEKDGACIHKSLMPTQLGVSAGSVKALIPKPTFWKKLWSGIKKFFTGVAEKPKNINIDDLKDISKTTLDIYDTYDKITTNPNYNYQPPQQSINYYVA